MPLTEAQQTAVDCTGRPLFIQAGAGTGKTFTLTKRVANALMPASGPILPSVQNAMIITFTNKAAGELLGRIRAELRSNGLKQAALDIDAAWISTIHAMCSSMLNGHAIEASIDPGMALLAEENSDAFLIDAFDRMLKEVEWDSMFGTLCKHFTAESAWEMVVGLARTISGNPDDAEYGFGPVSSESPSQAAFRAYASLVSIFDDLEAMGARDANATGGKYMVAMEDLLPKLNKLACADICSWSEIAWDFGELAWPKAGNVKGELGTLMKEGISVLAKLVGNACCMATGEVLMIAFDLATKAAAGHQKIKQGEGVEDTNDLLTGAYQLLRDNPAIAETYKERFKSIMVDEFQDTDQLQVKIVKSITDEALSTLTTVGDAQQSIYGFRGADLETYRSMRCEMQKVNSCEVELKTNYRSHPDILAFVESIFSKSHFFGDEFLRIGPGPNNAREYSWAPAGTPRVEVLLAAGQNVDGKDPVAEDMRAGEAELIAERFEELAADGARYGDMAILMRSTKKAGPYLAALRKRGIPCSVGGGSDFYTQPEVAILVDLLRVLENPDDERPLLELLASPMFEVPDDDLLSLRIVARHEMTLEQFDLRPKITLWDALERQAELIIADENDPLIRAYMVLSEALGQVGAKPLSSIVEKAVWDSGWMDSLALRGAAGEAVCANIRRFEDLLDQFAKDHGPSAATAADFFAFMCDKKGVRGKPGRMVNLGGNAVQIMTIHASKGLEFPIVAVAQYAGSTRSSDGKIRMLSDGEKTHLYLRPIVPAANKRAIDAVLDAAGEGLDNLEDASSPMVYSAAAKALAARRDAEESQRLLYVALTRARDMLLLVSSAKKYLSKGTLDNDMFADVMEAICPDDKIIDGEVRVLDTGCPVCFRCLEVTRDYALRVADTDEDEPEQECHQLPRLRRGIKVGNRLNEKRLVHSYSSIAHRDEEHESDYLIVVDRSEDDGLNTVAPVGSAFHIVAQWLASVDDHSDLSARIDAAAARYCLDEEQKSRLEDAVSAWCASDRFAQARTYDMVAPEHPFSIYVDDVPLEGSIDLMCLDRAKQKALLIDYKTGLSGTEEQLRQRYALQANCYAYAVLKSEVADTVEMVFVRPEDGMQEVGYLFTVDDLEAMGKFILEAKE